MKATPRSSTAPSIGAGLAPFMPDFRGDLEWIHAFEGHAGKPYWPGGSSGVTLDPGFDLGFHTADELLEAYAITILTTAELATLTKHLGVKGSAAGRLLAQDAAARAIRITREEAVSVMPIIAAPYWTAMVRRFPGLAKAPGGVQTAMLSLAFNRGPANGALTGLADAIKAKEWVRLAKRVAAMQQTHELAGIRKRRRAEGALIAAAAKNVATA